MLCLVTITAAAVVLSQVLRQLIQIYRIYQATTNSIIISEDGKICMCHVPIISLLPVQHLWHTPVLGGTK